MPGSRVAVLVPMDVEVRPVVAALPVRRLDGEPCKAWSGRVGDTDVTVHQIGVGPEHAARITDHVVERHSPDRLVVCGIAGGLGATRLGQVVVPRTVIDATSGTSFDAHPWGPLELDGRLVTTDGMWGAQQLADHVAAGVLAVDMETAAVAEVATRFGLAWTAVRAISDHIDEGIVDSSTLALTRPDGSTDVGAALRHVASAPWRARRLVRIAGDARRATHLAARTVATALGAT